MYEKHTLTKSRETLPCKGVVNTATLRQNIQSLYHHKRPKALPGRTEGFLDYLPSSRPTDRGAEAHRRRRLLGRTRPHRRRCRRRSSFRTRYDRAHCTNLHRVDTPAHPWLEAAVAPCRLLRSLRSRIQARSSTRVRASRARSVPLAAPCHAPHRARPLRTVTRLQCRLTEEGCDMHLDLDVNTDLWPLDLGDRFTFALASTLSLDGAPDAGALQTWGKPYKQQTLQTPLAPHGTPMAPSSAFAPRSTLPHLHEQAPTTRVISRRCSTSTSTRCTARYTSGSRRSPRRLCACPTTRSRGRACRFEARSHP